MSLAALLGETSPAEFLDDYFSKQPFSRPAGALPQRELGSWSVVEHILSQPGVDVMLARQGRLWEGMMQDGTGQPSFDEVRRLHEEGHTLVIRGAERHHAGIAELAHGFEREFQAAVNVHVYCTPREQYGFGWHYDAEDVFIVQTQGSKEYSLRKNTVHPWPLVETIPADMRFDREIMPVMKCRLDAGDWLYIPAGFWHVGQSQAPAISLAVGVMTATALDVLDFLRSRLLESLLWRQRLRPPCEAGRASGQELMRQYEEIFAQLGEDLKQRFGRSEFTREFLDRSSRTGTPTVDGK